MARRFRRQRKGGGGAWFPTLEPGAFGFAVPGNGDEVIDAIGLIQDGLDQQIQDQSLFGDIISLGEVVNGTGFHIKRIVGQVHCWIDKVDVSDYTGETSAHIQAGFGIGVLDCDELGQPNNLAKWSYAESDYMANMQRWLCHRMWILNPNGTARELPGNFPAAQQPAAYGSMPQGNWEYGDVRSGPHFDIKTSALVRPGQRVFMLRFARGVALGTEAADRWVNYAHSLRMYGTMRRNLKRS